MTNRHNNTRSNPLLDQGGWIAPALAVLGLILVAAGPVALHFGQVGHNQLPAADTRFHADTGFVPGEPFADAVIQVMTHELDSTTGWRPNDFILWSPMIWADNNSNRQLGIIQAMRESVRVLKDHLTKISSDEFDQNLVEADTALRNDAKKFWLPSAESKYQTAVDHLEKYIAGLKTDPPSSRLVNQRNVELIRLFQAWTDLLGGAHAKLYNEEIGWLEIDDVFYSAQGFAHVMHQLTVATRLEYAEAIDGRPVLKTLFEEVAIALQRAATMKPIMILNGSPSGLFANHRRNLAAFISEARQKMYSIREELEK